ncbi:MAG: hypothetical protein DRO00_06930 [Thermoproteota archaeon]|nr:MAG: hypothetical protein DRO00_06930 [Candidatus Korarchaeota archaeon]
MGAFTRAFRNISRRKVRVLLVVIALGFSIAVFISVPAGIKANQDITQAMTEKYQENLARLMEQINRTALQIYVTAGMPSISSNQQTYQTFQIPLIDESIVDEIRALDGVQDVVPFLMKAFGEKKTEQTATSIYTYMDIYYIILGVPFNSTLDDLYFIFPCDIEGRKPYDGESDAVLIGLNVSRRFNVGVGDTLDINGTDFRVVGVSRSSGLEEMMVYMDLREAQKILNAEGKVEQIMVVAKDLSYVDKVANELKAKYPYLDVSTYREQRHTAESMQQQYEDMLQKLAANLGQIKGTAKQVTLISLVATGSMVLFTMLYTVRERTKEIGIMKALGFTNWNIMTQFVLEGAIISLMGGIAGAAIGSVGAPMLATLVLPQLRSNLGMWSSHGGHSSAPWASELSVVASPDMQLILVGIGIAVLLGALGSLYPAWRASRIRPVEALRHE